LSAMVFECVAENRLKIKGEQDGILVEGEFEVCGNILINQDETLEILTGSTLFFRKYTGIEVYGKLIAKGEPNNPVLLLPQDSTFWNGIKVFSGGSVELTNVTIKGCVIGIDVPESEVLRCKNLVFNDCIQQIKIGKKLIKNKTNIPINIENKKYLLPDQNSIPLLSPQKPHTTSKYFSMVSSLCCMATWLYYGEAEKRLNFDNTDNLSQADLIALKDKRDNFKFYSIIGQIGFILSATVLVYTIQID